MSNRAIAKRYAQALLEEAASRDLESTVERDFVTINEIADASPDLRMLFRSPIIEWWRKKNIVKEVLDGRVNDLMLFALISLQYFVVPLFLRLCQTMPALRALFAHQRQNSSLFLKG